MNKIAIAFFVVGLLASCGSNSTEVESTTDSTSVDTTTVVTSDSTVVDTTDN